MFLEQLGDFRKHELGGSVLKRIKILVEAFLLESLMLVLTEQVLPKSTVLLHELLNCFLVRIFFFLDVDHLNLLFL